MFDAAPDGDCWTTSFYEGRSVAMADLYREHFELVRCAVSGVLGGADGETVIHEVFFRLISNEGLRRSYQSGAFASWLYVVAKNLAIDYARRRARETPDGLVPGLSTAGVGIEAQIEARSLIRQFREAVLPEEWRSVFELRFVRQLDQRTAARTAGIARTTLAYREHKIRGLLRAFLLEQEIRGSS
ncbi:MAG TPA: sigma-70 family RNA polymerase sigma factor [Polyangiaceae bacterium]|nr:sigma-70 family RNA polymerase sigma factor [Polyangiaceae bacterium]